MKLAEGAIGDVDALPEGERALLLHPLRVTAIDNGESSSTPR